MDSRKLQVPYDSDELGKRDDVIHFAFAHIVEQDVSNWHVVLVTIPWLEAFVDGVDVGLQVPIAVDVRISAHCSK